MEKYGRQGRRNVDQEQVQEGFEDEIAIERRRWSGRGYGAGNLQSLQVETQNSTNMNNMFNGNEGPTVINHHRTAPSQMLQGSEVTPTFSASRITEGPNRCSYTRGGTSNDVPTVIDHDGDAEAREEGRTTSNGNSRTFGNASTFEIGGSSCNVIDIESRTPADINEEGSNSVRKEQRRTLNERTRSREEIDDNVESSSEEERDMESEEPVGLDEDENHLSRGTLGKRRGRPVGSKNRKVCRPKKRSGCHYTDDDCLLLAKAWISQSEKSIQTDDGMWDNITKRCAEVYGLIRSKSSLRNKWASIRHDVQLWLLCLNRVRAKMRTGNISEEHERHVTQEIYRRRSKKVEATANFKMFKTAEFLSQYPKFAQLEVRNNIVVGMGCRNERARNLTELVNELRNSTTVNKETPNVDNGSEQNAVNCGIRNQETDGNIGSGRAIGSETVEAQGENGETAYVLSSDEEDRRYSSRFIESEQRPIENNRVGDESRFELRRIGNRSEGGDKDVISESVQNNETQSNGVNNAVDNSNDSPNGERGGSSSRSTPSINRPSNQRRPGLKKKKRNWKSYDLKEQSVIRL